MTSLKEGRCKRWSEEMAAFDFTHSSIRAWSLLRNIGGATHSKRQQQKVTENEVAHQLLLNGSVKKDPKQAKHILKQQRKALSDCPETSNLSQAFTIDEIINALKATQAGVIPPEQAGFRKKRNTCDQVLALTSYIESVFKKKLKTGAVLIELSAAYDCLAGWAHDEVMVSHQETNNNQTNRRPSYPAKLSGISRHPTQPKVHLEERSSPRIRTCAVVRQRIHK